MIDHNEIFELSKGLAETAPDSLMAHVFASVAKSVESGAPSSDDHVKALVGMLEYADSDEDTLEKDDGGGWESVLKDLLHDDGHHYFGSVFEKSDIRKHYYGKMGTGSPKPKDRRGYGPYGKKAPRHSKTHSNDPAQEVHGRGSGKRGLMGQILADAKENGEDTKGMWLDMDGNWTQQETINEAEDRGIHGVTRGPNINVVDRGAGGKGAKTNRRSRDGSEHAARPELGAGQVVTQANAGRINQHVRRENDHLEGVKGPRKHVRDDEKRIGAKPRRAVNQENHADSDRYGRNDPDETRDLQPKMDRKLDREQHRALSDRVRATREESPKVHISETAEVGEAAKPRAPKVVAPAVTETREVETAEVDDVENRVISRNAADHAEDVKAHEANKARNALEDARKIRSSNPAVLHFQGKLADALRAKQGADGANQKFAPVVLEAVDRFEKAGLTEVAAQFREIAENLKRDDGPRLKGKKQPKAVQAVEAPAVETPAANEEVAEAAATTGTKAKAPRKARKPRVSDGSSSSKLRARMAEQDAEQKMEEFASHVLELKRAQDYIASLKQNGGEVTESALRRLRTATVRHGSARRVMMEANVDRNKLNRMRNAIRAGKDAGRAPVRDALNAPVVEPEPVVEPKIEAQPKAAAKPKAKKKVAPKAAPAAPKVDVEAVADAKQAEAKAKAKKAAAKLAAQVKRLNGGSDPVAGAPQRTSGSVKGRKYVDYSFSAQGSIMDTPSQMAAKKSYGVRFVAAKDGNGWMATLTVNGAPIKGTSPVRSAKNTQAAARSLLRGAGA